MKKDGLNLIIITITFAILAILLYGKPGDMMIDFSRESYIPFQMLSGAKLNQDIFLIYGPFGYFINMLLYKISPNINLILIEANIIAYSITILFYYILKKYTKDSLALVFTLFFIIISVFSNSTFSFTIPYSYSTLWAVFGIYLVLFSILYKKDKLAYFTLGFIAVNKLEYFALMLVFIIIYDHYNKKFNVKNYLPTIVIPLLFLAFINIGDYLNNMAYISKMLNSYSLKSLYMSTGSYFNLTSISYSMYYLTIYLAAGILSYFLYKKNQFIAIIILIILFFKIHAVVYLYMGIFIALLLATINIKRIKKREIYILYTGIVLCSKSIFAFCPVLYSNFGFMLIMFFIFRQCCLILNKKWVIQHFIILLIALCYWQILNYKTFPKFPYKTNIGTAYLERGMYELFSKTDEYLKENVKKGEKIIVVPEGQIINLIYRTPWNFYNSTFTPLDFETFGEENIINQLKKDKTDYIIFYPRDTQEYGAKTICYDYAVDFCTYIMDNYERKAMYGNIAKVLIFKRNEK